MTKIKNNNLSDMISSFGYHPSNLDGKKAVKTSNRIDTVKKTAKIVSYVASGILLAGGCAAISAFFIFSSPLTVGILLGVVGGSAVTLTSSFVTFCVSSAYQHMHICKTAGIIYGSKQDVKSINPRQGKCEALPTEHSAETEQWRFKLVEAAEHNIVISGNYCGGKSFRDLLDKIDKRMIEKRNLKVVIISSPNFLVGASIKKLNYLKKKYPNRFSLIESPDTWHISPGLKKTTNHTKCMVIDYGKYYILGGSGIKDNFTNTGLDTLTKDEYLNNIGVNQNVQTPGTSPHSQRKQSSQNEPASSFNGSLFEEEDEEAFSLNPSTYTEDFDHSTYFDHLNPSADSEDLDPSSESEYLNPSTYTEDDVSLFNGSEFQDNENVTSNDEKSFIDRIVPGNFRDMDFVFRNSDNDGKSGIDVYRQMLLLAYRWERYGESLKHHKVRTPEYNIQQLAAFNKSKKSKIDPTDSVIARLMKTPIPDLKTVKTKVPDFDLSESKTKNISFRLMATGPEQEKSVLEKTLIQQFTSAKNRIVINHMYFHPTQKVLNALITAANRGVKIEIITCGLYEYSPMSHEGFVPRNKYNIAELINSVDENQRANIKVYEFQQRKKGNHKKAIVVDNTVIGGSSNLGYKSLVTMSDHELNFVCVSKEFADKTLEVFNVDKEHSVEVVSPGKINFDIRFKAAIHRLLAPLIG